jgi:membrane protease YdiL (CAAX protease family)
MAMLIFQYALFALLPVGIVVYFRLFRRVELQGPRTRPDLFMLPDMLAIAVVFSLMFLPAVIVRVADIIEAAGKPRPAAVKAAEAVPKPPLLESVSPPSEKPASGKPAPPPLDTARVLQVMIALTLPVVGMLAVFMLRGARLSDLFGLGKMPVHRAFMSGAGLAILAYPITFLIHALVTYLTSSQEAPQQLVQSFRGATNDGDSSLLLAIGISAVVIAPVCEEIIFRGAFYPVLSRSLGRGTSALLTAIIFALIHDTLTAMPSLAFLALCFTLAYEATGSLLVPIFMHASFNGINLVMSWWFIRMGIPE